VSILSIRDGPFVVGVSRRGAFPIKTIHRSNRRPAMDLHARRH